ncbi:hypothetical protein BHM03_00043509 [Ensete ventricosum]|nr:hypothetical protein BHM03_00043509 [Ensete ventricosum]
MEALPVAGDRRGILSAVPAALNGGDPLLHPPPAPDSLVLPSSPGALDPDAIFSLFDPSENGGDDGHGGGDAPLSPRGIDAPSRSTRSSASEYSRITVSDPQKEQETTSSLVPGSGFYVTYLISTRFVSGSGGGLAEIRVRRRFKDVVALADRLSETYRGYFVPQRPDKSVVEGQVMHRHEFVEQRRSAIEKYLNRLAAHPAIGKSDELRVFLRMPVKSPSPSTEVASRMSDGVEALSKQVSGETRGRNVAVATQGLVQPAKGRRDFMRMFRELTQSVTNDWGGVKPLVMEEDKEFLEKKGKLQDLEQQLTTASKQVCVDCL